MHTLGARSRMPISPCPPGPADGPRPSSVTVRDTWSSAQSSSTRARDARACFTVLVSASCTTRYAATSVSEDSGRGVPEVRSSACRPVDCRT